MISALRQAFAGTLTPDPSAATRRHRIGLGAIVAYQLAICLWLGWPEPEPTRWWDERFNVHNIESSLEAGRLRAENGYYGGVSYVPQWLALEAAQKLHAWTGWSWARMLNEGGYLTPAAYHVLRGSQALAGALALLGVYAVAKRLASVDAAVFAAALAAVSPRLIHAGAIFKPDIELLAATMLALLASWLAASRPPHSGRYLAAGAAIGLAVGAKLNGVSAAVPLVVATLLRWREWGRWPRLALAALASFVTYLIFNPNLAMTLRSLERNREHYDSTSSGGPLAVLADIAAYPFSTSFHGPLVASLAVVGLVALVVALARGQGDRSPRLGWAMWLSYPLVYYVVYLAASPRAKENHFLQIVPFVALLAAIVLATVARAAAASPRRLAGSVAAGLLLALAIFWPAATSFASVYRQSTPTTWELARRWAEASLPEPLHGRRVLTLGLELRGRSPRMPAYQSVASEKEVFGRGPGRVDGDGLLADERRLVDTGPAAIRFAPRWFRARGEPVSVFLFPQRAAPHPAAGRIVFRKSGEGTLAATLPDSLAPGTTISVRARLRVRREAAATLRLRAGGAVYEWTPGPASEADVFYLSPRFPAPADRVLEIVHAGPRTRRQSNAELFVWGLI